MLRVAGKAVLIVLVGNARERQAVSVNLRKTGFKHTPGVDEQVRASADNQALIIATVECFASLHAFCLVEEAGPMATTSVRAALAVLNSVCEAI